MNPFNTVSKTFVLLIMSVLCTGVLISTAFAQAKSTSAVSFTLASVQVPQQVATIVITASANPAITGTVQLNLGLVTPGSTPTLSKIGPVYSGPIIAAGTPFSITIDKDASGSALQADANYDFQLVETTTGTAYDGSFNTDNPNDQGNAQTTGGTTTPPSNGGSTAGGQCGSQSNQTLSSLSSTDPDLCDQGDPTGFATASSGWSWSCHDSTGGTDAQCTASNGTAAAPSTANGSTPTCGSADGGSFVSAPSDSTTFCTYPATLGDPVTDNGSGGWAWTCVEFIQGQVQTAYCGASQSSTTTGGSTAPSGTNLLQNPFKSLDSFPKIIAAVIDNIVLPIAVPFIAVMIIYSGFLFVLARKEGGIVSLKKAKDTLLYTLIGAALVLGAFVIANALQGTLNQLLGMVHAVGQIKNIV